MHALQVHLCGVAQIYSASVAIPDELVVPKSVAG